MRIIDNPSFEDKRRWGPLAYLSQEDRQKVLDLPSGQFKPKVKALEKAIREKKKQAKASAEYWAQRKKPV